MVRVPTEVIEVIEVIERLDARTDMFRLRDVRSAIEAAIDHTEVTDEYRHGYWSEWSAFQFRTHAAVNDGPWNSYFQPYGSFQTKDGTTHHRPDIAGADANTIAHWSSQAKSVKHPVLASRYADLTWDFGKQLTGKDPGVEHARLAIDSYQAALRIDDGEAWGDNHYNLKRMLRLAMRIDDRPRILSSVESVIDYADRTSDDDKPGTYCYLFDLLLPGQKGPPLTDEQEVAIVGRFERQFAEMTKPGGPYDVDPHSPRDIGVRLAGYYQRKDRDADRRRVWEEIARAFERRAHIGDAMSGLIFREDARNYFLKAGRRDEAERMQRESQEVTPEVHKEMAHQTFKFEIPHDHRQKFLDALMANGIEQGIGGWAISFVPGQDDLKKEIADLAKQYPLQAMFAPTLLGDEGIKARVDDTAGDPDGPMVWETSKRMKLDGIWMSSGLDHLIENGLTAERFAGFIAKSPVFQEDRLPLIQRGIQAHILGDYVQAIHVLIPQIERALVGLVHMLGGAGTKPHRSGRGVMQSKNLNDALSDEATREVLSPDLTIYLSAVLSHPKGLNIRNEVCHGLWEPEAFTKHASERVLHALTALSLLRAKPKTDGTGGEITGDPNAG